MNINNLINKCARSANEHAKTIIKQKTDNEWLNCGPDRELDNAIDNLYNTKSYDDLQTIITCYLIKYDIYRHIYAKIAPNTDESVLKDYAYHFCDTIYYAGFAIREFLVRHGYPFDVLSEYHKMLMNEEDYESGTIFHFRVITKSLTVQHIKERHGKRSTMILRKGHTTEVNYMLVDLIANDISDTTLLDAAHDAVPDPFKARPFICFVEDGFIDILEYAFKKKNMMTIENYMNLYKDEYVNLFYEDKKSILFYLSKVQGTSNIYKKNDFVVNGILRGHVWILNHTSIDDFLWGLNNIEYRKKLVNSKYVKEFIDKLIEINPKYVFVVIKNQQYINEENRKDIIDYAENLFEKHKKNFEPERFIPVEKYIDDYEYIDSQKL